MNADSVIRSAGPASPRKRPDAGGRALLTADPPAGLCGFANTTIHDLLDSALFRGFRVSNLTVRLAR